MNTKEFKEEIYEIAFGDNAINRNWDEEEVVGEIQKFAEASWLDEEEVVNLTEALNLVVEACSQWRNLDEPLGTIIAALNKFMVDGADSLDYRRERPTGFMGPKEVEEYDYAEQINGEK
jgi:hypothetical protein